MNGLMDVVFLFMKNYKIKLYFIFKVKYKVTEVTFETEFVF
jgi:hypothetical protein